MGGKVTTRLRRYPRRRDRRSLAARALARTRAPAPTRARPAPRRAASVRRWRERDQGGAGRRHRQRDRPAARPHEWESVRRRPAAVRAHGGAAEGHAAERARGRRGEGEDAPGGEAGADAHAQPRQARPHGRVVDDHEVDRVAPGEQGGDVDVGPGRGHVDPERSVTDEEARQEQRVPLGLGAEQAAGQPGGRARADRRVGVAVQGVALEVDARDPRRHGADRDVEGPQCGGEGVADAGPSAAGHAAGLVEAEGDAGGVGKRLVAVERRALGPPHRPG